MTQYAAIHEETRYGKNGGRKGILTVYVRREGYAALQPAVRVIGPREEVQRVASLLASSVHPHHEEAWPVLQGQTQLASVPRLLVPAIHPATLARYDSRENGQQPAIYPHNIIAAAQIKAG